MTDVDIHPILLSIVIPVAKMAGRLDNLRISLEKIPSNNVEVILVDDRQDEETGRELTEIASSSGNRNVKVVSGYFGSPGLARNAGMDLARGNWITFWDSDDRGFVDPIIQELKKVGPQSSVVIGQFQVCEVKSGQVISRNPLQDVREISKSPGIWRFVFRNENLVRFKNLSMGEDQVFIALNLPEPQNIIISKGLFYTYFIGNTYQLTYSKEKIQDLQQAVTELEGFKSFNGIGHQVIVNSMRMRMYISLFKYDAVSRKLFAFSEALWFFPKHVWVLLRYSKKEITGLRTFASTQISLTGGLGNQLFQIAAANALSDKNLPDVTFGLGIPRKSSRGIPDILEFRTDGIIGRANFKTANIFFQKIAGYNLRMGINPRSYERNLIARRLIVLISSAMLSIHVKRIIVCQSAHGVGYQELAPPSRSTLFLGYFQSYKWVMQPGLIDKFRALELLNKSEVLNAYLREAEGLRILGIHIRLGDYKDESNFGILSRDYYQEALVRIFAESSYDVIWIFSDEPKLARSLHSFETTVPINWIEDEYLSAAETLQLFRRCDGYVIANSSFSWWAAMLSQRANPTVIAPSKWFLNLEDPVDLIPPSWIRLSSNFLTAEQAINLIQDA